MGSHTTDFTSIKHGFKFENQFAFTAPFNYRLPLDAAFNFDEITDGLCGGMCFTALDYYHNDRGIPGYMQTEAMDAPLRAYLYDRQVDSIRPPTLLKMLAWMGYKEREIRIRMLRYELPKVKRAIRMGKPVTLAILRSRGNKAAEPYHIAVAAGFDEEPNRKGLQIHVYDPNHPGADALLTIRDNQRERALELRQSTGEPVLAVMVIPYKANKILPETPRPRPPLSFEPEEAPLFRLRWPVDSRRVNQYFNENPLSYRPFGLPGHEGLDLFAPSGANVYAAYAGRVTQADFPANHPYGRQVRIRHDANGVNFETIYAHLQTVNVGAGQEVSAGEWLGQADNTGNSFGSHLHFTLKISGQQTPGYPAGIVDPWPYLRDSFNQPEDDNSQPQPNLPPLSSIRVYTTAEINLRAGPTTEAAVLGLIPSGEFLSVYGNDTEIVQKIGKADEWLRVRTAAERNGYAAAWLVRNSSEPFPPTGMIVYPIGSVNLRSGPGTVFDILTCLQPTDALTVLGSAEIAQSKLGKADEWLQVQTGSGLRGYAAAWLVKTTAQYLPGSNLNVYTQGVVNIRALPSLDGNILTVAPAGEALECLEDPAQAETKIGMQDQWLNVRTSGMITPDRISGFTAAWLLALEPLSSAVDFTSPSGLLHVCAAEDAPLHAQPAFNSPVVGSLIAGNLFSILEEDPDLARNKVGMTGAWLYGKNQAGKYGWAAARNLKLA